MEKKTHTLRLITSANIDDVTLQDKIEEKALELKKEGVIFQVFGINQLSEESKSKPELIDDFFGRNWVNSFCSSSAKEILNAQAQILGGAEVIALKKELHQFYQSYFQTIDHGLIGTIQSNLQYPQIPSLIDRFIIPDVIHSEVQTTYSSEKNKVDNQHSTHSNNSNNQKSINSEQVVDSTQSRLLHEDFRTSLQNWMNQAGSNLCLLGEAGSGKSTLLRCIALDLLSGCNIFSTLSENWINSIPILLPFSRWTKEIEKDNNSRLDEVLINWLKSYGLSNDEMVSTS